VSNRERTTVSDVGLSTSLTDQLSEAVACPPDPHTRSVAIAGLIAEVFETVRWLHGSEPDREELASLYRVLAEAYAHRSRMSTRAIASGR
jgi:hypothetical protein